jgi:large subunit ribosomal protein L23
MKRDPYQIIKSRHVTEKASVLSNLENNENNRCVKKCNKPKVVFIVDVNANKQEIAKAFEKIYERKKVKVESVNTIVTKPKPRKIRGRIGKTTKVKKAIITLQPGNHIDTQ